MYEDQSSSALGERGKKKEEEEEKKKQSHSAPSLLCLVFPMTLSDTINVAYLFFHCQHSTASDRRAFCTLLLSHIL